MVIDGELGGEGKPHPLQGLWSATPLAGLPRPHAHALLSVLEIEPLEGTDFTLLLEFGGSKTSLRLPNIYIYMKVNRGLSWSTSKKMQRCQEANRAQHPKVDFLGYLITPQGICPNPQKVTACTRIPCPQVSEGDAPVCRTCLILPMFHAKVAQPLHALTQKGAVLAWTQQCQDTFDTLRSLLVEVLSHAQCTSQNFGTEHLPDMKGSPRTK